MMFYWHNRETALLNRGIRRPVARDIHNSYCAGVVVYSQHICAHRSFAIGKGGLERRTLRRWGFDFVVAAVANTEVPVAGEIEHRVVPVAVAGHRVAFVAAVEHRGVFAVDTGNFGKAVALHTGLAVVNALPALFHNSCKIVDRQ